MKRGNALRRAWRGLTRAFNGEEEVSVLSDAGWTALGGSAMRPAPGSSIDYDRLVGDPSWNATCSTIIGWVARTLPESPAVVTRTLADGTKETVREHPILDLLNAPNPHYSGDQLMAATIGDYMGRGQAFWRIVRNAGGAGKPVQLFYIPERLMRTVGGETSGNFIDHYEYMTQNGVERIAPSEIVHLRYRLDPLTMGRTGMGPWTMLKRSLHVLNMGENFEAMILTKHGAPGLHLALGDDGSAMTPDEARQWKQVMLESTTMDHVGEPIVTNPGSKLTPFGFSPEQLALGTMLDRPEAMACAAAGINPVVLGLKVGLEHSTYSNQEEAQRAAYEKGVIPMKSGIASDVTIQLLNTEFERPGTMRLEYDYSQVACLQEKEDEKVKRLVSAAGGPYLTPNEAREQAGLDPDPGEESDKIRNTAKPEAMSDERGATSGGTKQNAAGGDRVLAALLAGWSAREGGQ